MSINPRMSRRGKWTFPSIMQLSYECIAKINIELKQRITLVARECLKYYTVHTYNTAQCYNESNFAAPQNYIKDSFHFPQLFVGCQAASDDQICPELIRAVEGVRYIADITRYCLAHHLSCWPASFPTFWKNIFEDYEKKRTFYYTYMH